MKSKSSGTRSVTFSLKYKHIIWGIVENLQIHCVSQLTNKTISNSQTELENRLHQLTETLIQKQTMLEALGTEKSSLVFQLERLEEQLKNAQGGQSGGPSINMSNLEGPGRRTSADPEHEHEHEESLVNIVRLSNHFTFSAVTCCKIIPLFMVYGKT